MSNNSNEPLQASFLSQPVQSPDECDLNDPPSSPQERMRTRNKAINGKDVQTRGRCKSRGGDPDKGDSYVFKHQLTITSSPIKKKVCIIVITIFFELLRKCSFSSDQETFSTVASRFFSKSLITLEHSQFTPKT